MWSLGVILFAMLCGRLPFEGPDLIGTKRPREAIIKTRITKCQYKIDEHLGSEAKDLVRRMLQLDPAERASIPEIFNHVWMRSAVSGSLAESFQIQTLSAATRSTSEAAMLSGNNGGGGVINNPSSKETGRTPTTISTEPNTPSRGGGKEGEKEGMSPLERSESMPQTSVNKVNITGTRLTYLYCLILVFAFFISSWEDTDLA